MISVTPDVTLAVLDTALSPDPNPIRFGGGPLVCAGGVIPGDAVLPASTSNYNPAFPPGVTTAAVLAVVAAGTSDLVVKYKGQSMTLPLGQPALFYGVGPTDVSFSSVIGGHVTWLVGG